ncbi:MAG: DivIVA domain-containing protein [Bdellovibrionales bacterium]|nr:DivIVA domain-containing protein [Bdellovibrionales bacterium]
MKIAPIDVAHKSFSRKMMGADTEEVMDFLRIVADEMEQLIRERNEMRETLREKELQIIEYKERDDLLKSTITTATKMSDKIQTDAEREARLILNDAKQQAEMIVRDARDSLKKIYGEVTALKNIRMQFENNLRAIVQSHITMLDQGNQMMPSPEFAAGDLSFSTEPHAQRDSATSSTMATDAEHQVIKDKVAQAVSRATHSQVEM